MTKSRKSSRAEIDNVRVILNTVFPQTFMPKGADKLPLKIGIDKDLKALMSETGGIPGVSIRTLNSALADYTLGLKYLYHVVEGAARIDLNGMPAGYVTKAEEERSQHLALERKKLFLRMRARRRPAKATETA